MLSHYGSIGEVVTECALSETLRCALEVMNYSKEKKSLISLDVYYDNQQIWHQGAVQHIISSSQSLSHATERLHQKLASCLSTADCTVDTYWPYLEALYSILNIQDGSEAVPTAVLLDCAVCQLLRGNYQGGMGVVQELTRRSETTGLDQSVTDSLRHLRVLLGCLLPGTEGVCSADAISGDAPQVIVLKELQSALNRNSLLDVFRVVEKSLQGDRSTCAVVVACTFRKILTELRETSERKVPLVNAIHQSARSSRSAASASILTSTREDANEVFKELRRLSKRESECVEVAKCISEVLLADFIAVKDTTWLVSEMWALLFCVLMWDSYLRADEGCKTREAQRLFANITLVNSENISPPLRAAASLASLKQLSSGLNHALPAITTTAVNFSPHARAFVPINAHDERRDESTLQCLIEMLKGTSELPLCVLIPLQREHPSL